jgi:MFS family permease
MSSSTRFRVVAVFSLVYFVSYLFRGVNLGFAPHLSADLGISAAQLGLLTSLYFLGFAAMQIPSGVLLDRYGSRRVVAGLLVLAAIGSLVFGHAHGVYQLMIGRALIGVGVAACLAAAFKALAEIFPVTRLSLMNGLVVALGGLGGVVTGSPLSWLLARTDWRAICTGLAVFSVAVAIVLLSLVPETRREHRQGTLLSQFKGIAHILKSPMFWKLASLCTTTQATFYAMQSLWVQPYMRDVSGMSPALASLMVSTLGISMVAGCVGFGALGNVLRRKWGMRLQTSSGLGMLAFIGVQVVIVTGVPVSPLILWACYGALGATGILTYAVMAEHFPPSLSGRVNTTLTLVMFSLVFVFQSLTGSILGHWPAHEGHYPAQAHLTAWGILLTTQVLSAIWYFYKPARQPASVSAAPLQGHR